MEVKSKYKDYYVILKSRMSDKRLRHSVNVANEAEKLAIRFGHDSEQAYLAGLLHDICKEMPDDNNEAFVTNSYMDVSDEEKSSKKLWHAISGAEYIKNILKIDDMDLINSVRYHTVARAGMSPLEKIVYLADYTCADRNFDGVDDIRKACKNSLDIGMLIGLKKSINILVSKGFPIPPSTFFAYNQYASR